jgi:DNA-binding MarR family transcriptional regulator
MPKKTKTYVSSLKTHIGYHLRVVSNAVSHSFAKKLSASDVTVAEWVILREMYSGDETISPSTIAELTMLTRGAVSKLIDRLLKKGLVTRSESLDDRRYQNIKLSPSALKLIPKLAAIADENDHHFFSALTQAERDDLIKILKNLSDFHKLTSAPIE